ncbi:hypothetical protein N658DRAFT_491437 [Parathielavia hyrcaniae]|uniref:Calcineurin-like phosphoesterase domain-containing protein n=1 Tax=Parathielavia hyrcaniae TaxID=113614 RepID=A0AAN6QDJ4_9PEZI|nr:hypothetical protein N658DRAFT_491437 [Parathielavia hyrcaniae]
MPDITTRCLVLSNTHADPDWKPNLSSISADVVLHCDDLTEESKISEFRSSIELLKTINAPLKLVIAGNHNFSLDAPLFKRKIAEAATPLEPDLIKKEFGDYDEARGLFADADATEAGIAFLDEGQHTFALDNGALLTVYASPYTPSPHSEMGFQYKRGEAHDFSVSKDVDVVMTHGPPRGILDMTDSKQRSGCEHLFAAVARARPQMHCFGHIHEGWGAKLVAWRGTEATDSPSHFTNVDNACSTTLETLSSLKRGKWDTPEVVAEKEKLQAHRDRGYCSASTTSRSHQPPGHTAQQTTLFVNAAIQDLEEGSQLPWLVDLQLPQATEDEKQENG